MKAIILAAGRGSRLHPYTENCPKCLTILDGETLLARQIRTFKHAGINDITVVTGFLSEMIDALGIKTVHNPVWNRTNMVESLFCAEQFFSDSIIVSYGDIVFENDVLQKLINAPFDIAVVVDRLWRQYWELRFEDPLSDAESLQIDGQGCICNIGSPVVNIDEIEAQYTGLMKFGGPGIQILINSKKKLGAINRSWMENRNLQNAYMTDLLMEIILTGNSIHAVPVNGGWLEIDTVSDFKLAETMLNADRISLPDVP